MRLSKNFLCKWRYFILLTSSFYIYRITQLIANSARCSKKRLFPLENEATLRNKKVETLVDGNGVSTDHTGRDFGQDSSDSDDSRTTLGEAGETDKSTKSSEVKLSRIHKAQSILGSSSSQPLRLRRQNVVDRNKNHIYRFVGDKQAATDMGMANLFGAHPAREHNIISLDSTDVSGEYAVGSHSYYDQVDESLHLAGIDVEPPSAELLECIKSIATDKIMKQMATMDATKTAGVISETVLYGHDYSLLAHKFDESALVAVGILVEELVRDMMINWYKSGNPLTFDPRALRTEALAQMNGSTATEVPVSLLKNRLEVRHHTYISRRTTFLSIVYVF